MSTQVSTEAKLLRLALNYDESTGVFTRRVPAYRSPAGTRVGTPSGHGYQVFWFNGKKHYLHRLAFLWMNGAWPEQQVDHIDGNRANNAWRNLRDVSLGENQQNRRAARKGQVLGVLGVSKARSGFCARIYVNKKRKYLGIFSSKEEASAAYLAAKRELHPTSYLSMTAEIK